jgi:hypothetical protein
VTDRELIERAARAAGVGIQHWHSDGYPVALIPGRGLWGWNPLEDDGDALRLAVRLQLTVGNDHISSGSAYCTHGEDADMLSEVRSGTDEGDVIPSDYAATRRAIVLAAAELLDSR